VGVAILVKSSQGIRYLSFSQVDRLLASAKEERDSLILQILYEAGCTVSEIVNLKASDVIFDQSVIRIRHGNSQRPSYVSRELSLRIRAYCKSAKSAFVFSTRQSDRMTTKRVRQIVESYGPAIGCPDLVPQLLRYTHIVHAHLKNVPLDAIRRQVGLERSRAIEIFTKLPELDLKGAYANFIK
jgi:integrase/recombinase XerD